MSMATIACPIVRRVSGASCGYTRRAPSCRSWHSTTAPSTPLRRTRPHRALLAAPIGVHEHGARTGADAPRRTRHGVAEITPAVHRLTLARPWCDDTSFAGNVTNAVVASREPPGGRQPQAATTRGEDMPDSADQRLR